jgi:hypothetical protein
VSTTNSSLIVQLTAVLRMPVQSSAPLREKADVHKQLGNKGDMAGHQTPPPKKKEGKSERASMLCSTPPTCLKDKDSHVEYTRKEFLGEVVPHLSYVD